MRSVVGRLLVAAVAERSRGARLVFQVGDVILHVFRDFRHYSGREEDCQRGSWLMADEQRLHLRCRCKSQTGSGLLCWVVLTFEEQGR